MTGTLRGVSNKHCLLSFFFIWRLLLEVQSGQGKPCHLYLESQITKQYKIFLSLSLGS